MCAVNRYPQTVKPARQRRHPPLYGRNIDRLIRARGATVTAIAAQCGMGVTQLTNIKNDPRLNPSVKTLERVATALGVDLAILFAPADPQEVSLDAARLNPAIDPAVIRRELIAVLLDALSAAVSTLTRTDPRFSEQGASVDPEESSEGRGARRRG